MIAPLEEIVARFPALARLDPDRRRRVPEIRQATAADCGAACLAMVLGYHGAHVPLEEVRSALGIGRDGTSAHALIEGALAWGLRGRGIRVEDPEDLAYVERGSILHWNLDHFVVLDRVGPSGPVLVDPAHGRRTVPWSTVREHFSGVVVELVPGEGFERRARERDPLWRFVGSTLSDRGLWARIVVVSALLQALALAVPILVGVVVDRVVPLRDVPLMWVVAVGILAVLGFGGLATLVRGHLLLRARIVLDARLTLGFVDHLVDLPYAFFETRTEGDLMMRVGSASNLREILTAGLLSAVLDGMMVALLFLALLAVSPAMALVAGAIGSVQVAVLLAIWRRQHELMAEALVREAVSQSFQLEMLRGMETLKAMGLERAALSRWSNLFVDVLNVHVRKGELAIGYEVVSATARTGGPLAVLWTGAWLALDGSMSLGEMLAANAMGAALLAPMASLVDTGRQAQLFASYFERIRDVMAERPEGGGLAHPPIGALEGQVEIERVTFRYGRFSPVVLDDVSLAIRPGEWVAVVGRSGSGKSTLARLVLGLAAPTSGQVRLDGVDLSRVDLRSVRRRIGLVAQSPSVFGQTIRESLQLAAPEAPFAALVEAAVRARIHDEILAMPMGYDTPLVNGGSSLSGGQRQRLALARALARAPAVLVLDEATSALDAVTEAAVHEELARLPCTRLVIAHRLSTVRAADRIVVLDGGRIAEQGTHDELLRSGGAYSALVAAQIDA